MKQNFDIMLPAKDGYMERIELHNQTYDLKGLKKFDSLYTIHAMFKEKKLGCLEIPNPNV